jgi:hypothetical protein
MAKKAKQYSEGELLLLFKLDRIVEYETPRMKDWLTVETPVFGTGEQYIFDKALKRAIKNITGWSEEDLKMKFISSILPLGDLEDNGKFMTYYEKILSGEVEGIPLTVKSDFMVATGALSFHKNPYFHFHEYKPQINPTGEPMAQLLIALLLGQEKNKDNKPIYGAEVTGQSWRFVILEGRQYCISRTFDCLDREDLLMIVAILRKFRVILETELLS